MANKLFTFNEIAAALDDLRGDLPETISLDDLIRHKGLRRIALAADDIANRIDRRALEWAKSQ